MTPEEAHAYTEWWKRGAERIATAFYRLPSQTPEHLMSFPVFRDKWGHYFMQMYRGPETEGMRNVRQQKAPASRKATDAEIARALKASDELIASLDEMHRPAVESIGGPADHGKFRHEVSMLNIRLQHPQIPATFEGDGKGRPTNAHPLEVAIEVGRLYRHITGRHPTITKDSSGGKARGPFITLLTEVFDVLSIPDSEEGRGAAAIKAIERLPENKGNYSR